MKRLLAGLMALAGGIVLLCLTTRTAWATGVEVYVDDSAPPGGDGTEEWPVQTIQEGIAVLPRHGGTVLIYPGTYIGPILVDRDDVVLWGLANAIYDAEGYLTAFWSDDPWDDEVLITTDRRLIDTDYAIPTEPEDLVEVRGSNNEVHNVVVDLAQYATSYTENSAFSAKAEDDDFYDRVVFSHIIARGHFDTVGWSRKANVLFEYITSLGPGYVGISPTANGHVEVRNVHIANKNLGVCFIGLWERPRDENGPSLLTGVLANSKLRDANGNLGNPSVGAGLWVPGRGGQTNPAEPSDVILEVRDNVFDRNRVGIEIIPDPGPEEGGTEDTFINLRLSSNTYLHRRQTEGAVRFLGRFSPRFATNATVVVEDGDGVFPDAAHVDLGPEENGNVYILTTP